MRFEYRTVEVQEKKKKKKKKRGRENTVRSESGTE